MFSFSYFSGMVRALHTYDVVMTDLPVQFTKKDFDAMRMHSPLTDTATLELMRDKGLVKVVRKEECGTKEIELPAWEARYVMIDRNGNELMEEKTFLNLPAKARTAMLALNGEDFKVERKGTKTIQLTRNYYMLCASDYDKLAGKAKEYKARYIDAIHKKIEKAQAKLAVVNLW